MVDFRITYTLSMHSHPPKAPRTPYPPAVGKQAGQEQGEGAEVSVSSGLKSSPTVSK